MVTEYIRYQIASTRSQSFIDAYRAAAEALRASPYCLGYEISQGVEEPERFVVRIEWTSREEHEQGFRQSPQFPGFLEQVKPFFADIVEMKHYQQISAHKRSQTP